MPTRLAPGWMALTLLLSASAWAGDKLGQAETPYKLQLDNAADYRLQGAWEASPDAVIPAALALKPHAREIEAAAKASRLDPVLVHALIHAESGHRHDAVSRKGAIGLMQLMPETALRFGVDQPHKVRANLRTGTRYLRQLLDRFDGRLDLALAAYNAGEGAVQRHRGIPPYAETRAYVPAVMENYAAWRQGNSTQYMQGQILKTKQAVGTRMTR